MKYCRFFVPTDLSEIKLEKKQKTNENLSIKSTNFDELRCIIPEDFKTRTAHFPVWRNWYATGSFRQERF